MTIDHTSARAALDSATHSATALRRGANSIRWTMIAFAATSAVGLVLIGLGPRPVGIIVGTVFIVGAGTCLGVAGATSGALPPRFRRRYATTLSGWGFLYAFALLVGLLVFPGSAPFWICGALVCAAPGLWFFTSTRTH